MSDCTNCGFALNFGAKFCGQCGNMVQILEKDKFESAVSQRIESQELREIERTVFIVPSELLTAFKNLLKKISCDSVEIIGFVKHIDIKKIINTRIKKLFKEGKIAYVCLIGNWEEIPPFGLKNPLEYRDGDEYCYSDAPYGIVEENSEQNDRNIISFIPEIPVGRIPTTNLKVLENIFLSEGSKLSPIEAFQFAVSAECWKDATEVIAKKFMRRNGVIKLSENPNSLENRKDHILSSPNWSDEDLLQNIENRPLQNNSLILFNVHGSGDVTSWFGEGDSGTPEVFHPGTIPAFANCVMISEACYGGALSYDEPSVVEHFFNNGGRAFVGCSVIAYGTPDETLCGADLMALNFINAIEEGMRFGEALNYAKLEVGVADPECSDVSDKTVISFNLFGAPWQKFKSTSRMTERRHTDIERLDVRNRVTARMDEVRQRLSNSMSPRREAYISRLPKELSRSVLDKIQFLKNLSEFRDYRKISESLSKFNININECDFEKSESLEFSGYRITGKTKLSYGSMQSIMIIADHDGCLKKIVVSKGQ